MLFYLFYICDILCFISSVIQCALLRTISRGSVSVRGKIATYTCSAGYKIDGVQQRECQADGQWSGYEPKCSGEFTFCFTRFLINLIKHSKISQKFI